MDIQSLNWAAFKEEWDTHLKKKRWFEAAALLIDVQYIDTEETLEDLLKQIYDQGYSDARKEY